MLIKPAILPIHAIAGAVGVGSTVATDALFFEFMKDFNIDKTETKYAKAISKVFWIALVMLYITGIALALSDPDKYLISSKFITKMVAVVIVTLNGLFLHFVLTPNLYKLHFNTAQPKKFTHLKQLAYACGVISLVSWITAFILGSVSKIPVSAPLGIGLYLLLLSAGGLVSQAIFYRNSQ